MCCRWICTDGSNTKAARVQHLLKFKYCCWPFKNAYQQGYLCFNIINPLNKHNNPTDLSPAWGMLWRWSMAHLAHHTQPHQCTPACTADLPPHTAPVGCLPGLLHGCWGTAPGIYNWLWKDELAVWTARGRIVLYNVNELKSIIKPSLAKNVHRLTTERLYLSFKLTSPLHFESMTQP